MDDGELNAIARELNRPILDALENPPPEFKSARSFSQTDLETRLQAIVWFGNFGDQADIDISIPFRFANSWDDAVASCTSVEWENTELAAQNQLTLWLHNNHKAKYQDWNKFVVAHKENTINPLIEGKIQAIEKRLATNVLTPSVQWNILGALMENTYLYLSHTSTFFLELFAVYESGHLPCGWVGDWPSGELVVY